MIRLTAGIATVLLSYVVTMSAQSTASAAPAPFPKVILVELFTSEGCSSCPPADALLRQIDGTRPRADQLIVGISEHVTYWNSLGWTDPFSSSIYTDRQNAYGGCRSTSPKELSQFCTVRAVTFRAFANCSWLNPSLCLTSRTPKEVSSSMLCRGWVRMLRAFKSCLRCGQLKAN